MRLRSSRAAGLFQARSAVTASAEPVRERQDGRSPAPRYSSGHGNEPVQQMKDQLDRKSSPHRAYRRTVTGATEKMTAIRGHDRDAGPDGLLLLAEPA
jgi:hypothetical protein